MDSAIAAIEVEDEAHQGVAVHQEGEERQEGEEEAQGVGQRSSSYVYIRYIIGAKSRTNVSVLKEPHRHPGVFVARGKEDML